MATVPGALTRSLVTVRGLSRRYGDRTVLRDVDLDLVPGEFVAVLGASGSGKSTLLRALAGLDHEVDGAGLVRTPDEVSVIFQDSRLLPWARIGDNVTLGLDRGDTARLAAAALAEVGLGGRERAWPNQLSGGEQQRVALARSLVREPALLLADEPFGALDALTRLRMHALLRDLHARHRPAVLLVTHDVDEAVALADRVLVLQDGRVVADRRVDLPTPRGRHDASAAALARDLLAELGVLDDPPHPRPELTSSRKDRS